MPLTFDLVEPRYMDDWNNQSAASFRAHIVGAEPRELVSVRVTYLALETLAQGADGRGMEDEPEAIVAAATRFQPILLAIASRKFDADQWTLDGIRKVVEIGIEDVPGPR